MVMQQPGPAAQSSLQCVALAEDNPGLFFFVVGSVLTSSVDGIFTVRERTPESGIKKWILLLCTCPEGV